MGELFDYLVRNEDSFRGPRIGALYSDFRSQKTLNPDGYHANIATWIRGLADGTLAGHASSATATTGTASTNHSLLLLTTGRGLTQSLESPRFGRPLCLGTVLREAIEQGAFIPQPEFLARQDSIYRKRPAGSWASIPAAILWWGLRQVGFGASDSSLRHNHYEDKLPDGTFVVVANLEAAAQAFQARVTQKSGAAVSFVTPFERTFTKAHFQECFSEILPGRRLSDADFDVFLRFLARDKGLVAFDNNVVRVRSPTDPQEISPEDHAVASLRALMANLETQVATLTVRSEEFSASARAAVARSNRPAAAAALRARKLTDTQLERQYATLAQLRTVAADLERASDQVQLVAVMRDSATALRALNARVGGAEGVVDVLEDLREEMAKVEEVGAVITDPATATVVVDEAEVDYELEKMAKEEADKKVAKVDQDVNELKKKLAAVDPPAQVPVSDGPAGREPAAMRTAESDTAADEAAESLRRLSVMDGIKTKHAPLPS